MLSERPHSALGLIDDRKHFFADLSQQIQKLQQEHPGNSVELKRAFKALQNEHHVFLIACRLAKESGGETMSRDGLFQAAERILGKYSHTSITQGLTHRRTKTEELFCNAARQSWHKLLKRTGVLSVEHRRRISSTESRATALTRRLRKLKENRLPDEEGAGLLKDYAIFRGFQLLEVLDQAQEANSAYLRPEVITLRSALRAFLRS